MVPFISRYVPEFRGVIPSCPPKRLHKSTDCWQCSPGHCRATSVNRKILNTRLSMIIYLEVPTLRAIRLRTQLFFLYYLTCSIIHEDSRPLHCRHLYLKILQLPRHGRRRIGLDTLFKIYRFEEFTVGKCNTCNGVYPSTSTWDWSCIAGSLQNWTIPNVWTLRPMASK